MSATHLELPYSIDAKNPFLLDKRSGPWASKTAANAGIPEAVRVQGLVVIVQDAIVGYYYKDGIEDVDLVPINTDEYAVWGQISGTLSDQADLQAALDAKEDDITPGTTAQYWRGDKTWQTLTSDAAQEGATNLYFTPARAQNAITLSTNNSSGPATYSGGTLNIPNYTLSGLGGEPSISAGTATQYWRGDKTWQTLNTAAVPESGGNVYYTESRFNNSFAGKTTSNLTEGNNLYYTDARVKSYGDTQYVRLDGSYTNPSWIVSLPWSKVTNTPTTIAGYGITDAFTEAESDARYVKKAGDTVVGNLLFAAPAGIDSTLVPGEDILNIGAANASIINIGWSGATINIQGSVMWQDVDNLAVTDKLIRLNKGGAAASGVSSGFEIEENAVITGWLATDSTRTGWDFKAPASNQLTLGLDLLSAARLIKMPNADGTLLLDSRQLTINGTVYDLSTNRSWTVGDVRTDGSYSNPAWITGLAWSKITGTPTTAGGYGITDVVLLSTDQTIAGNKTFSGNTTLQGATKLSYMAGVGDRLVRANTLGTLQDASGGTFGINITGNAATVTNGVYTTGSYANPSWITSLDYSKLTGTVPTWNQNTTGNAATVTNGVYTTGSYANPAWITSLAWSKITGTPTTLAGYGISDAYTTTQINNFFSGASAVTGYNKSNWDTAFGWGNHASAGYITPGYQYYIGTTLNALNRAPASQTLTGVSIDGNAATATYASNSALLQGYSSSVADVANTIALRDGNGYLRATFFYDNNTSVVTSGMTSIYGSTGDRYMYKFNASAVQTFLGLGSAAYITASQSAVANTVAQRTNEADIYVRLLRTEWTGGEAGTGGYILMQNAIGAGAVDNYARPTSMTTLRGYMGLGDSDSTYMRFQGFTLDANTMLENRTGFTYGSNAPYSGPILHVGAAGYGFQFNATYSGGGLGLAYRSKNGDAGTWNTWRTIWHDGNFTPGNYVPYTGATTNLNMGGWNVSANLFLSDGYYSAGVVPMMIKDATYNRLYRGNGIIGIYLGGSNAANYYDNTTHYIRNSGGGSNYAIFQSGMSTFYGESQTINIDNTNRTTYRDIVYVTAQNGVMPYTGHGGGILFRGATYYTSSNVAYARIGTFINSQSINTYGSTLFFDIATDAYGSTARAFELYWTGKTKWFYNSEINGSDRVLELKGPGGGNNSLLRYSDGANARYSTGYNNGNYIIFDDVVNAYRLTISSAGDVTVNTGGLAVTNGRNFLGYTSPGLSYTQATVEVYSSGSYGPRIALHYGGVVASQISVESSGRIAFINNPGTSYENIVANTANFVGLLTVAGTGTFGNRTRVGAGYIADIGGTGNSSGIAFGASGIYPTDGDGAYSSTKDLGYDSLPWRSAYLSGAIRRTNPLGGYLNGGYASIETTTTPGLIYAIGYDYLPTASALAAMYGVGYTHGSFAGDPMGSGGTWGFYVAAAGVMYHRFGQEAYRTNVPIVNTSASASSFSGNITAASLSVSSGGTLGLVQGDIWIQSNGGYGILSANASRAIAITNSQITLNYYTSGAMAHFSANGSTDYVLRAVANNTAGAKYVFLAGVTGVTNGFSVYHDGAGMVYNMATGNLGVEGNVTSTGRNSANYFDAIYSGADGAYNGSFDWNVLQLGNNGPNYIVAGHNVTGGWLDFYVNNTNRVPGTTPNGIHAMRINVDGTTQSQYRFISSNYSDFNGSNNVNLGNGGIEGRGMVAGYSGSSYAGIGYNVRHTSSSATWTAPGGDAVSYLLFNAGFTFSYAAEGAAGRDISGTLGRIARLESCGDFKIKGALFPGYDNAASYSEQGSYYLYGNTSNQGLRTNGNLLINGDVYVGASGMATWLSSWLNQSVKTDASPTFANVYTNGWFFNNTSNVGLVNAANNTHFYSSTTVQWDFASAGGSYIQLALRPGGHASTVRGYLYADTSNNVGLLGYDGNWALRMNPSKTAIVTGGISDGLYHRMVSPQGGTYVSSASSATGAIKIRMPLPGSSTMMSATVKVYEYITGRAFTLTFAGHTSGGSWYNTTAYIVGDQPNDDRAINVRFGTEGGYYCVWIGETSTTWSYPQVWITDVQIGYFSISDGWASDWAVSFEIALGSISQTRTVATPSSSAGAYSMVRRDSNGYVVNSYFYTSVGGAERNGSGLGYFAAFNSSDYYIRSYTPTAARAAMGLSTGDNVTFNTVTATTFTGTVTNISVNYSNNSAGSYQMIWGSGTALYGTAGIYCDPLNDIIYASKFSETSDRTLKTPVQENFLLPDIHNVKAHLYTKNGVLELGYYAQEVQPYLPHAVSIGNGKHLNLTYREVFVAKISSLEDRTEQLERKVKELETELAKYKTQ